jgi:hypothetical protein
VLAGIALGCEWAKPRVQRVTSMHLAVALESQKKARRQVHARRAVSTFSGASFGAVWPHGTNDVRNLAVFAVTRHRLLDRGRAYTRR